MYHKGMRVPQLAFTLFLLIFSFLCRCALFSFTLKITCNQVQKLSWSAIILSQPLLVWKEEFVICTYQDEWVLRQIQHSSAEYTKAWNRTSGIWLMPILHWQQTTISFLHSFNSRPHRNFASAAAEQPTTAWKYFGDLLFTSPSPSWIPFILLCNLGVVIQSHYGPQ